MLIPKQAKPIHRSRSTARLSGPGITANAFEGINYYPACDAVTDPVRCMAAMDALAMGDEQGAAEIMQATL